MRIYNAKKFENDYKSDRNTLKFRTCNKLLRRIEKKIIFLINRRVVLTKILSEDQMTQDDSIIKKCFKNYKDQHSFYNRKQYLPKKATIEKAE